MSSGFVNMGQMRGAELDARRAAVVSLMQAGSVNAAEVADLRRHVFGHDYVNRDEAEALLALEMSDATKCPEWNAFFIEALTDHVVWEARPTGIVNESQAEWLIEAADRAHTLGAFAVLINVLAEAHRLPLWFLAAVKARALKGWPGLDEAMALAVSETADRAVAA